MTVNRDIRRLPGPGDAEGAEQLLDSLAAGHVEDLARGAASRGETARRTMFRRPVPAPTEPPSPAATEPAQPPPAPSPATECISEESVGRTSEAGGSGGGVDVPDPSGPVSPRASSEIPAVSDTPPRKPARSDAAEISMQVVAALAGAAASTLAYLLLSA